MRGLMIAAVAVAGLTLGGQAQAQGQEERSRGGMSQMDMRQGGRVAPLDQVQSEFPADMGTVPFRLPAPRFDPRAQEAGTGGSGSVRSETMEVKGVIRSVSDKGMTITVPKENNRIVTLRADNQVQLLQNDEPLALSSLKLGDEVRASYEFNEEGQKMLRSLEVTSQDKAAHKNKK